MLTGALPFSFFIAILFTRNKPKPDPQIHIFLSLILISVFIVFLSNGYKEIDNFQNITEYFFNVTSILTTTGYASGDFMNYSGIGPVLFFFLIFIGGCAGSTSGGIKIYRFIVLWQLIRTSLKELIFSRGVFLMRYGNQVVDKDVFKSSMVMVSCFFGFLAIFTIALGALGLDFITALSGAATTLANVGPGIGEIIGPSGNFSTLGNPEKYVLIFAMIIGRLELLVALALFLPMLWRY